MSYLVPSEFVTKMVDAGESKVFMATKDTLVRAFMAGAILALAAAFAITIIVTTGNALLGAVLFPVGFCMLYLMGFDLLTGVFVLCPLALIDKRPGVTMGGVLRNWGLVFIGNFAGALTVAFMMAFIFTSVSGKVISMWMPIMLFFFMAFEHSVVNMFLFPSGIIMGGDFSVMDYLVWNEIPTVLGNLVGGLAFTGLTLYSTHIRTNPQRAKS
jgi:formate/nitrite transporter FocA (FNT family)